MQCKNLGAQALTQLQMPPTVQWPSPWPEVGPNPALINIPPFRAGHPPWSHPKARPNRKTWAEPGHPPPLPLDVRCTGGEDVDGSEACLLARRHKNDDRLLGRVLGDGMVHGLGHGQQASLSVADVEALGITGKRQRLQDRVVWTGGHEKGKSRPYLDVQLQGHGAHVRVEVESGGGTAPQPVGHVLSIGERGAKCHNADGPLNLGGDIAHPRADHFQDRLRERDTEGESPQAQVPPWP